MFLLFYLAILGLFLGSFLNVLIDRLPREESIFGRSHCDTCKHKLSWYDLIPVMSFLQVKGKCRYCRTKFSFFYPFIEIFTATVFFWVGYYVLYINGIRSFDIFVPVPYSVLIQLFSYLFFLSTIIVILFADIKYHIIPDSMQVCFFLSTVLFQTIQGFTWPNFMQAVIAGVIIMLPILILFLGTKGKGMGFGDVKLAFNMGFLLGIWLGLIALYIAFVIGGIVGLIMLILRKKKAKSHIAFGPYLLLGTLISFFYSQQVVLLFRSFIGI